MAGNITASDAVELLDFLLEGFYRSSPDKASSPYACEFNGLAELTCGHKVRSPLGSQPIRAVGLAGLFVPAPWATGGVELTLDEARTFYTAQDFEDMKTLGLNTIQISVPTATFQARDKYGSEVQQALVDLLDLADHIGLKAILALVSTADELDDVVSAAAFADNNPAVLGLTLPKGMKIDFSSQVTSVRVVAPKLPLFVPINGGELAMISAQDKHVYAALEMSHSATVADIASSDSKEDRSKLFYHEATACMARSPLEYLSCFRGIPAYVASGFDLSIDDCIHKGEVGFKDYGQCDRFDETKDSGWWRRHRESFAARQIFAYERGLGWCFATWKLYGEVIFGVLDEPAKLLSLKDVTAAGLFPPLDSDLSWACLNNPNNDFALGDATLAPTMGPPPDCGNGWWNYTAQKCDYWIPPPPTPKPTPSPTVGCPLCETCETLPAVSGPPSKQFYEAALGGALVAFVLTAISFRFCLGSRRDGYSTIRN